MTTMRGSPSKYGHDGGSNGPNSSVYFPSSDAK